MKQQQSFMNNLQAELMTPEHSVKKDLLPFSDFLNNLKVKVMIN
jgi:hypothetical protein